MKMDPFFQHLSGSPDTIEFSDTMSVIEEYYDFTETAFENGELLNDVGKNNGSCKLFAFAQLHELSKEQTLACFGTYYREDVLNNPEGCDHQNIRNFIKHGWPGILFSGRPLQEKS